MRLRLLALPLAALGLTSVGLAAALVQPEPSDRLAEPRAALPDAPPESARFAAVELPSCTEGEPAAPAAPGDPQLRQAAQRGLDFLSRETVAWQQRQQCYGCHVQAVTLEALAVGHDNQYEVARPTLQEVVRGVTTIKGGSRSAGGLQYHGGSLVAASKGFGGAAFARYDELVDAELRDDLLSVAERLLVYQEEDGALNDPESWVNRPVGAGPTMLATQAITTWRQAYERSADERWLTAMGRTEGWLRDQLRRQVGDPSMGAPARAAAVNLQELNYGIVGLLEAGASTDDAVVVQATEALRARQLEDGGFGLHGASDGFATGQSLYSLRRMGYTDADPVIARATDWLVGRQQEDGSWGRSGEEKAVAMWAVLGLVGVDLVTVDLVGVQDGQRLDGSVPIEASARANEGVELQRLSLYVDDQPMAGACGSRLRTTLDAALLGTGKHVLDVRAETTDGRTSRRRLQIYTGDITITRLGTAWSDGGTRVSFRDVAPADDAHRVLFSFHEVAEDGTAGAEIGRESREGAQGPLSTWWNDRPADGSRYIARVRILEVDGSLRQQEERAFVHADPAVQRARYADVEGRITLDKAVEAANTTVELLDDLGNVVGSTLTTRNGQYRFKNIDAGEYRVRVKKEGWGEVEAAAAPAVAEDARIDLDL